MPTGSVGYSDGRIANQVQRLAQIDDELGLYNRFVTPWIDELCVTTVDENVRVFQGAGSFEPYAEGSVGERQKGQRRVIKTALDAYSRLTEWTKLGIQDMLESEVQQEVEAAMRSDQEKELGLMMYAGLFKRTASVAETASITSFYNGETDVPDFGANVFNGTAEYHYAGINTTTLARSHIDAAVEVLAGKGYEGPYYGFFSTAQESDVLGLFNPASATPFGTPMAQRAIDSGLHRTGITYNGVEMVFSAIMPSGYFMILDRGVKPFNRRIHDQPQYQGLLMERGSDYNNPMVGAHWLKRIGFSVRHLGAGVCRQIVADTAYTNPSTSVFPAKLRAIS